MREIKFRAYNNQVQKMTDWSTIKKYRNLEKLMTLDHVDLMQYTGLKDKNGVEIYEYMEIDDNFEVSFKNGCYVLTNISNGDIILLYNYIRDKNGQVEITKEYTKI